LACVTEEVSLHDMMTISVDSGQKVVNLVVTSSTVVVVAGLVGFLIVHWQLVIIKVVALVMLCVLSLVTTQSSCSFD